MRSLTQKYSLEDVMRISDSDKSGVSIDCKLVNDAISAWTEVFGPWPAAPFNRPVVDHYLDDPNTYIVEIAG